MEKSSMPIKRTITFNSDLHKYTDEDNNVYTSVTQLIDKFKPEFNKDYWAEYKAKQLGVSKEEILESWKKINQDSLDRGNKIHNEIEDSINLLKEDLKTGIYNDNILNSKYPKINNKLDKYILEGYKIYAEKRVYLHEYLVAGTIDCLLVRGKEFKILDWKTNKDKLMFKSGYFKKVDGIKTDNFVDKKEYLFEPIQDVENCKGMLYTLQLSMYAYMCEQWGMKCTGLELTHITGDFDNLNVEFFDIKYAKEEVGRLLYWNKNQNMLCQ